MKRRILLVDDEVTVLLTLKAVLEVSGFDVHTATSAREGRSKIRHHEYDMVITDMRMESEAAGAEVVQAARVAPYHPAVALLTAFPVEDDGWNGGAPDKVLVKATQTRALLAAIETLFVSHAAKMAKISAQATQSAEAMRKGQIKATAPEGNLLPEETGSAKKVRAARPANEAAANAS